ncbi:molybdopterin-dependent oxidoreductase [Dehalobacterium formicoaceticum]|uniref:Molybdopterin-dependent oxidoreductase n=2 Tax=Dehalobacterium formicoaceticum TaxID=51515 RepID=A0ABT1Y827_9FIRM|nr:molybdopterin cofactor-binding domain-containing protein [Dehalobacterium formicoaceticum]MCR6547040.1 molybdopterin-dependent oxidoreductase [Dehalobacterium formicoaceticum]
MVQFWVNEQEINIQDDEKRTYLLDYLRDVLKLTGTKRGCEEAVCGACTVLIDNEAKRSCRAKLSDLQGKHIVTVEGLVKDGEMDPVQKAFVECSAVQCGFCTPGMIMTAKALLLKNPDPSEEEIKKALKLNLCRCGTYPRVIKAIQRAAVVVRGETPEPYVAEDAAENNVIGKSVRRIDVEDKVTGKTVFYGDYYFDNMLYGKMVLSQYPHAKILSIDTTAAEQIPGVQLVLTAKDIPGNNIHGVLAKDQPVLAVDKVRYIGEPIVVVFAEDEETAQKGADAVQITYKELPGIFTIEEALAPDAPLIPNPELGPFWNAYAGEKGNICKEVHMYRGNIEEAFAQADVVVEEEFVVPPEEHAWMETDGAVSRMGENGKVLIYAPNQSPFADRDQLAPILNMDVDKIEVVHMPAGGAFGGKTELTTHAYVAIASLKTGRPAKMVLTRKETLRFHPKRHSYKMKYRVAANKDGKIQGMDIQILADGGAYISWSPRVVEQSVSFSTGPYYIPNLNVQATCVYTNNLIAGAMRGFGAGQSHFAAESTLDILSRKLNMDPITLREINALEVGVPAATGQIFTTGVGYKDTIQAIKKVVEEELLPLKQKGDHIGIGVASAWRSVAGGLGPDELAGAALDLLEGGKFILRVACTEMGQGSHTSLCQMVSEILDIDITDIEVDAGNTGTVPYGGGVMASRGVYLWGHPTIEASKKMRKLILEKGAAILGVDEDRLSLRNGFIVDKETGNQRLSFGELAAQSTEPLKIWVDFMMPKSCPVSENTNEDHAIDPKDYNVHHTVAYNTTAVAVAVDPETGNVTVLNCTMALDGGQIINPEAARTQIEGAIIMGMGYGMTNDFEIEKGINKTDTLGKCKVPRINDMPDSMKIIFVGDQDLTGPFGSKGVAEIGVLSVAPAITNAIYDAVGVRVNKLPVKKYLGGLLKK